MKTFTQQAEAWGTAMSCGDATTANQVIDKCIDLLKEICDQHDLTELAGLFATRSDVVRFLFASELKTRNPAQARELDRDLETSRLPFVSLSSDYILIEMENAPANHGDD